MFADELVPRGTQLWKFLAGADQLFTPADVERCPEAVRTFLTTYAALVTPADNLPDLTGKWLLCMDGAMFMNHDPSPNYGFDHHATRDILPDEEIVCAVQAPNTGSAGGA